jgi:hypothetical protein
VTSAVARIRALEVADVQAVTELVVDVLAEFGFAAQVGGIERDLQELRDRYRGTTAGFWVARRTYGSRSLGEAQTSLKKLRIWLMRRCFRSSAGGARSAETAAASSPA